MPTAARLIAAISLAITGFVLSLLVMPLMPESTDFGYFIPVNIGLGLLVGWFVMGRRAGRGVTPAINNGFTGVFVLMFWGVAVQAINEMVRLSMRNRYDGPGEAMVAVFEIGAEYALIIATVQIGLAFVACSLITGLVTEIAARNWR